MQHKHTLWKINRRSFKSLLIFSILSKLNLEKASKELDLIMLLNVNHEFSKFLFHNGIVYEE